MKYVVLHSGPDGLVMSQLQRDLLFSTGNVIGAVECPTYSLQLEYFQMYTTRPLTLVLWGMEDRYGLAGPAAVDLLMADRWGVAYEYCRNLRPHNTHWTDEDGQQHPVKEWKPIEWNPLDSG